ncbi:CWC16 protein [Melampsora americana]|nr:CWC16 protein [Melampsora americana]
MSERKVLNKYYPPDFDPAKIPRRKLGKDRQQVVRLMAPFSMQCKSCTEFIYKGKKFNARKEAAAGEHYFGIKIFRFYIKCPRCSNEITFKTDPKNSDYIAEHGAQRNFEPWREEESKKKNQGSEDEEEEDEVERLLENERLELEEKEEDSMKSLEKNQIESKREMEILDKLQEIRSRNARMERSALQNRNADGVLSSISSRFDSGLAGVKELEEEEKRLRELEEDEVEVAKFFSKVNQSNSLSVHQTSQPIASGSGSNLLESSSTPSIVEPIEPPTDDPSTSNTETITIKRKYTEAEPDLKSLLSESSREMLTNVSFTKLPPKKKKSNLTSQFGIKIVKKTKS